MTRIKLNAGIGAWIAAWLFASMQEVSAIDLGFANPLSGASAASGRSNLAAVREAVDEINANGGLLGEPINLIVADDACGIEGAARAANDLVAHGVDFVIGHLCSHSTLVAAGIYEMAGVPMLTMDSTHPQITEEGRRNVFRMIGRDDRQGDMLGTFIAHQWPRARVAILHDDTIYGRYLATRVRRVLEADLGNAMHFTSYEPGQDDYRGLADELIGLDVEVLAFGGYGSDIGAIIRAMREAGSNAVFIGGDGLGMEELWSVAGDAAAGTIFSARPNPGAEAGKDADPKSEQGRAAVEIFAQAVARAGSADGAVLATMLEKGSFDTVLGTIEFDEKGDLFGAGWQLFVWSDGVEQPLGDKAALH